MDWLTGGRTGEAKRLIVQLSDSTKRERAAQDLIRMGVAKSLADFGATSLQVLQEIAANRADHEMAALAKQALQKIQ